MAAAVVLAVRLVDEHGDRPAHDAGDLEHLLEHVAARVLEVDQDDVGIDAVDLLEQARGVAEQDDVGEARLAQASLEDGAADGILFDHQDLQRRVRGRSRTIRHG